MAQGFEFQYVAIVPSKDLVVAQLACAKGDGYMRHKDAQMANFVNKVIAAL